jgi:transcriptional regulator with XRE-family HTH domain
METEVVQIVGKRLRALREGVKLSQKKIGNMIGASQVSINRYESGGGAPPLKTLMWYADYFDVSLDYIFGRTDKPQGELYEYHPKIGESSAELKQFVEMCFDPNSPMNDRLKQTLLEMLGEVRQ